MESRTRSSTPSPVPANANKISAYYSLVFPHFTFYIQTLSVTIGRRCNPSTPTASSSSSAELVNQGVDVDLGALKSVSRLHAKIEYDPDEDRFMLLVIGRNGAWVDGVWQGSGTRAPLGERGDRSQIQIASRTFHFVLPPPPEPPEDTPSPGSNPSSNEGDKDADVDVDVTSISPPSSLPSEHSPPPPPPRKPHTPPPPPEPEPQLGNSNLIARSTKKRKKNNPTLFPNPATTPPPPQDLPKPNLTYAQLIYRAITTFEDGKATLQEICAWISKEFEYYRVNDGSVWMSSVRHNLSSNPAFKKLERCGGDRGKGFFWAVDEAYANAHSLEEQLVPKEVKVKVKTEPPKNPLTYEPKPMKSKKTGTGMKTISGHLPIGTPMPTTNPNPYAVLQTPLWMSPSSTTVTSTSSLATVPAPMPSTSVSYVSRPAVPGPVSIPASTTTPMPTTTATAPALPSAPRIPIILGPVPPTHPSYSPSHPPNYSAKEGYMILHTASAVEVEAGVGGRMLILDPGVFGPSLSSTGESKSTTIDGVSVSSEGKLSIKELEDMGATKAIEVLTGILVRVLKERRKAKAKAKEGASAGRGRGRGRGGSRVGGGNGRGGKTSASAPAPANASSGMGVNPNLSNPTTTNPLIPVLITQSTQRPVGDAGSPIVVVDSDDDEGEREREEPATKKRKVESEPMVEGVAESTVAMQGIQATR